MRMLQLSKTFAKKFLSEEDKKIIARIDRIIADGGIKKALDKNKGKENEKQ